MNAGVDLLVYIGFAALGLTGAAMVFGAILRPAMRRPATPLRESVFRVSTLDQGSAAMSDDQSPVTQSFDHDALSVAHPGEGSAAAPHSHASGSVNQYPLLASPHICLSGPVDQAMYQSFRQQLADAPATGAIVIAISTLGGDPELARLMGDEVRLLREFEGREFLFLGKVAVYSAGATFMSAFPVDKRFLTRGTRIMIHERIMNKTVEVAGPLKTCVATLKATLHEIEHSIRIEEEGFRSIVEGSRVDFDELVRRAPENWYIEAEEAREKGLVLDVI